MAPNPPVDPRPESGPHPALSLVLGFGLIVLGATVVHVVFNVLV
ncbi:hypothetical protein [Brevundimonas sp.]|nr:hypothetical protein [Brevundimonas sp.]HYD27954.1 hypothetical protein [Brevundimonas sp.]